MLVVKNLPASAGDVRDRGSIPGSGRSPGGGHGNPLQYSCLENPTDRGTWWATVHRAAKSWTWLKWLNIHPYNEMGVLTALGVQTDTEAPWDHWEPRFFLAFLSTNLNLNSMNILSCDNDGWSTPVFPAGFQAGSKWKMKMQSSHENWIHFFKGFIYLFSSWEAIQQLMLIGHELAVSHEHPSYKEGDVWPCDQWGCVFR